MTPSTPLSPRERSVALACLATVLVAAHLPAIPQPLAYHLFADWRTWAGVPHAADVLSNVAFALLGALGLWRLQCQTPSHRRRDSAQVGLHLFFAGLLVTAVGSSFYHLQPDDVGLAVDRLGMVLPFAGLLGLAASQFISERAARWFIRFVVLYGFLSVSAFVWADNVVPWALLQGAGLLTLVACMAFPNSCASGALPVRWGVVVACYAVAKGLESHDVAVFEWSQHLVSGHSLKHVAAACAAWPILSALTRQAGSSDVAQSTGEDVRAVLPLN